MKKVLIGCGVITLVVFLLLAGVVTYSAIKVRQFTQSVEETGKQFKELEAAYPFTAPTDPAVVQSERLAAFFESRKGIWMLVANDTTIQGFFKAMSTGKSSQEAQAEMSESFGLGEMMSLPGKFRDLASNSVKVLEANGMSFQEYIWITRHLYSVLDTQRPSDTQLQELYDKLALQLGTQLQALDPKVRADDPVHFASMLASSFSNGGKLDAAEGAADQLRAYFDTWVETPAVMMDLILLSAKEGADGNVQFSNGPVVIDTGDAPPPPLTAE